MKVRLATEADHEQVMAIQAENPGLMSLDPTKSPLNGPVLIVEDDNGNIVGVGMGRRTVEAFLYVKPSLSNFAKAKATKVLAESGFRLLGEVGYGECHLFTSNHGFARMVEGLPGAHQDSREHLWVDLT